MRTIVVGTRQSKLAMTQTGQVVRQLETLLRSKGMEFRFELKPIQTRGDRILDVTLSKVGGKGLFVKEIEQALIEGQIDMAVHSMKDMPTELPEGLVIGAIPKREDPRDCLIAREGTRLDKLPAGARIGTSSLRRAAQLLSLRPDIRIEPIRGNIDTRLRKMDETKLDGIVLASAGLQRMGWQGLVTEFLDTHRMVPAVGQGALAVECRADDRLLLDLLGQLHHGKTGLAVSAERAFLAELQGGCQVPIGAYAEVSEPQDASEPAITLTGMVASPDGRRLLRQTVSGPDPVLLGRRLARTLLEQGADRLLAEAKEAGNEA